MARYVLLIWLALAGSCLAAQTETQARSDAELRLKKGSVLEVFVWKEPDLTRTVTVRSDGKISLPLVQDLVAEGLTPDQLRQEIETRLKVYVSAPAVTVIVQPSDSFLVYVIGNVTTPGLYRFREPLTVLQALAMGGRFGDFANVENIVVVRGKGPAAQIFRFNYKEILKGRGLEQNLVLQSEDVVMVP